MSKTKFVKYVLMVFMIVPFISFAGPQKKENHKVMKGDTLWGIAGKEFKDPFTWPNIWKENAWIKNPNLIYPGQIIKIRQQPRMTPKEQSDVEPVPTSPAAAEAAATSEEPAPVLPEPVKEDVKKEEIKINTYPLIDKTVVTASGYITDNIPGVGRVGNAPSNQKLLSIDDLVYVDVTPPAKAGDKFYVIKASERVRHPATGEKIGYVITIKGILEIVEIKNETTIAKITKSFEEIVEDDILDPYYDIDTPMTTGKFRSPDVSGFIIATSNQLMLQSMLDIVYIDKGCKDGIEPGDVFKTLVADNQAVPNGKIKVISCRDHTATAIIEKSRIPVSPGNLFETMEIN